MSNKLLQRIKDDYARQNGYRDWDSYPITTNLNYEEVAQRYAEAYHASRIQEIGQIFNEEHYMELSVMFGIPGKGMKEILGYLNTRAAEYAAGKVAGMYTEKQVIAAVRLARKGNIIRGTWSRGAKDEMDYTYSDRSIINQIKGGQ